MRGGVSAVDGVHGTYVRNPTYRQLSPETYGCEPTYGPCVGGKPTASDVFIGSSPLAWVVSMPMCALVVMLCGSSGSLFVCLYR